MPFRTAGGGSVSSFYLPTKPKLEGTRSEKFKPAKVNTGKLKPLKPAKGKSQKTPAPEPPQVEPPPTTRLPSPPPKWALAPSPKPPAYSAPKSPLRNASSFSPTESPAVPGPTAQPPSIRHPIPGLSTQNKLKPHKSVPTLLDGRVDGRSGSILAASKSNPVLNKQNLEPPKLRPDSPSITPTQMPSTHARGLLPGQTPPYSSLLNNKPIQPPSKTEKPGFFGRLFGFGKSKSNEPKGRKPPNRPVNKLTKSTTPGRPMSIASLPSVVTLSSTTRQRAVLVKKPPTFRPTKTNRPPSVLARPGMPSPRQNLGHSRYYDDPQDTASIASFNLGRTTSANATNYATPPNNNTDFMNYNHAITANNPAHATGQTYGGGNRSYGTNHIQGPATTDYLQHPGTNNHHCRSSSYTYGNYSRARDPGYQSITTTPGFTLCAVCNTNPQYIDPITGETSPYCSDFCQAAAPPSQQGTCSYPGCTYPAVMYPADYYWNYCSESHEHYARKGCIKCRQADYSGTQLCKGCDENFKQLAPAIIPVPTDHDAFWHVVDRFTESWAHPTQCPVVQAVFKVALAQDRLDTYLGYRDTLEYYCQFAAQGKPNGNERVFWHGTRRGCYLGEKGQTTPCTIQDCSLCSIIRGSFDMGKFAKNTRRFGKGIYTSTKASKAGDYSSNDRSVVTTWKAVLLNNVAAGHECVMRHDDATLTAPPWGFNSVHGEAGGSLNYDELVVYTNDAIRPTWLVLYKRDR